jgi:hypothetical protein
MVEIYAETPTRYRPSTEPTELPLKVYRDHMLFGREVFEAVKPHEFAVLKDQGGLLLSFRIPQLRHGGGLHRVFISEECYLKTPTTEMAERD